MRYVITGDGLLIAGSEAGMVPVDETTIREKGALGPGQMIAVDMAEGRLYHDAEMKDKLASSQPYGEWIEKIVDLNSLLRDVPEQPLFAGADLRRRQIAAGYTFPLYASAAARDPPRHHLLVTRCISPNDNQIT